MHYQAIIDDGAFLVPLLVWVEEDEDPVAKIREAVTLRFPGREIPEFIVESEIV